MTGTQLNVNLDAYSRNDAALAQAYSGLILNLKGDHYAFELTRATRGTFFDMVKLVKEALDSFMRDHTVAGYSARDALLVAGDIGFITVRDKDETNGDPWASVERDMSFAGHGNYAFITKIHEYLSERIEKSVVPTVIWTFAQANHRSSRNVQIKRAQTVYPEFYPWIGDVEAYYERYLESESAVLILLGETGTAKTSFIRNMIWRHGMSTMFTYDEVLLEKDEMFADFMTGNTDLLIVEDADILLTDRENGGNKLMSKFLNIGDGLAAGKHKKKIIFTANMLEMARIDSALLRPGRCFDCRVFRKLTFEEACAAARVAGIPAPVQQKAYSLAELFALGKGEPNPIRAAHPGFMK